LSTISDETGRVRHSRPGPDRPQRAALTRAGDAASHGWTTCALRPVCGSLSCDAHAGQCAHSACEEGGALQAGCDVDISCVSKVCAADADPFCCNAAEGGFWDEFCIAKVNQLCSIDGKPDACTP
jgi:hypothetical protein